MRCDNCKNVAYCVSHKEEPEMLGCTSGIPAYLPANIAQKLIKIVEDGATKLGLDKEQYLVTIVAEAYDRLSKEDK